MILDLARLLVFPALIAFAASSDIFSMRISNRVSLLLAAGISLAIIAVVNGLGTSLNTKFTSISSSLK